VNADGARNISEWKRNVSLHWPDIKVVSAEDNLSGDINLGGEFKVNATVALGAQIKPEDVSVQVYFGNLDSMNRMSSSMISEMTLVRKAEDGTYVYDGAVNADRIGHCGYVVRVLPKYQGKVVIIPKLITWQ